MAQRMNIKNQIQSMIKIMRYELGFPLVRLHVIMRGCYFSVRYTFLKVESHI